MSYSFGFAIVVLVAEQNVILQRRCSWLECCARSNHAAAPPPFGVPVEPQAPHARLVGNRRRGCYLVQAAVITAVLVKEQDASSGPSLARGPDVAIQFDTLQTADTSVGSPFSQLPIGPPPANRVASGSTAARTEVLPERIKPSDKEIAALEAGGRQLMLAGDIPNARLVLQQAAEAGNATAALLLGATYDPTFLPPDMTNDRWLARLWYEKAKALGSTEAAVRLERPYLRDIPFPMR
jgi:hypothetical protein